jgi:2-iminobutanoate/2-iminopropanoate deaminase
MMHKKIVTDQAPKAIGPYSQAIVATGSHLIFISGQIPLDPVSLQIEAKTIAEQTQRSLKNLQAILQAANASWHHVVKTTVFLKDMNDFSAMNAEYEKIFTEHKPARACIEVARLPRDVLVEIEAIAVV